ncbi:MAG: hypothetical protein ACPL6D_14855 [Thermodesulfobacteriota bacterium]
MFTNINYRVYSPKVLAGINRISETIEDRSFKITMTRKTSHEKVERLNLSKQMEEIRKLKHNLYLFALNYGPEVGKVYSELPEIKEISPLDDRLKDILEPILCIALIVDEIAGSSFFSKIIEFGLEIGGKRKLFEGEDKVPKFCEILLNEFQDGEDEVFIPSAELLSKIQKEEGFASIQSSKKLATLISSFGDGAPSPSSNGKVRGYKIRREWVEDLRARYGVGIG